MCNSAYIIHAKMKVNFKISEMYVFSPKFNIRIISIKHSGLILPHYWGKTLLSTFLHAMWFMKIFSVSGGTGSIPGLCEFTVFPSSPSSGSFLRVAQACVAQHSADTWAGPSSPWVSLLWLMTWSFSPSREVQGLTCFITHLSRFTALHCLISNVFKPISSYIFFI